MNNTQLILAGGGHSAISAYDSLVNYFSEIHLITDDPTLKGMIRKEDSLISDFSESNFRYCVCAGYQKLIEKPFLKSKIIINIHGSLLPKYRGLHSIVWAMLNLEKEIGLSIHLMNEYMDDGNIIAQHKIENNGLITSKQILDNFDLFISKELGSIIRKFISGEIKPVMQDRSKATWVPKRNLDDCIVQFDMPNRQLSALFKALVEPYPLPQLRISGQLFEITDHEIIDVDYYCSLGRVINIENRTAFIKTKDGILLVKGLRDVTNNKSLLVTEVMKIGQRL